MRPRARNKKLTLLDETELELYRIEQKKKSNHQYYTAKKIKKLKEELKLKNDSPMECKILVCVKSRKVKSCAECIRHAYCSGEQLNPFTEKSIDLFLDGRRE